MIAPGVTSSSSDSTRWSWCWKARSVPAAHSSSAARTVNDAPGRGVRPGRGHLRAPRRRRCSRGQASRFDRGSRRAAPAKSSPPLREQPKRAKGLVAVNCAGDAEALLEVSSSVGALHRAARLEPGCSGKRTAARVLDGERAAAEPGQAPALQERLARRGRQPGLTQALRRPPALEAVGTPETSRFIIIMSCLALRRADVLCSPPLRRMSRRGAEARHRAVDPHTRQGSYPGRATCGRAASSARWHHPLHDSPSTISRECASGRQVLPMAPTPRHGTREIEALHPHVLTAVRWLTLAARRWGSTARTALPEAGRWGRAGATTLTNAFVLRTSVVALSRARPRPSTLASPLRGRRRSLHFAPCSENDDVTEPLVRSSGRVAGAPGAMAPVPLKLPAESRRCWKRNRAGSAAGNADHCTDQVQVRCRPLASVPAVHLRVEGRRGVKSRSGTRRQGGCHRNERRCKDGGRADLPLALGEVRQPPPTPGQKFSAAMTVLTCPVNSCSFRFFTLDDARRHEKTGQPSRSSRAALSRVETSPAAWQRTRRCHRWRTALMPDAAPLTACRLMPPPLPAPPVSAPAMISRSSAGPLDRDRRRAASRTTSSMVSPSCCIRLTWICRHQPLRGAARRARRGHRCLA